MPGDGTAFADAPEQQDAARSGRDQGDPFPAVAPVNPEMLPEILLANIQPCNCAATATSCGAAEIVPWCALSAMGPTLGSGFFWTKSEIAIEHFAHVMRLSPFEPLTAPVAGRGFRRHTGLGLLDCGPLPRTRLG